MALKKKLTNNKGIASEYHMISGLTITDRIEVVLKSYTDESYRNLEKEIKENKILEEELNKQVLEEMVKENPDQELMKNLEEQINSLNTISKDYSVDKISYRMPFDKDDDISYKSIYKMLKQEAMFEDAEDC